MKKYVFLTAIMAVLAVPGVASSQDFSENGLRANRNNENTMHVNRPNNGNFRGEGGPQGGDFQGAQAGKGQRFQRHKAEMIQRITRRLSCVQAANDGQALEACISKEGGRLGGGNRQRPGSNGQRPSGGDGLREQQR